MTTTTDIAQLSAALLDSALLRTRVAVSVRIDSFDASTCTATVTPLVNEERVIEGERVPIPSLSIPGCPVIFPYGDGKGLTFGLSRGDTALGLFRHRSHDEIDGGAPGPIDPQSTRRMREADLVVLAGYVVPGSRPSSDYRSDGAPVMPLPVGDALHVGSSTATYALVREDLLSAYLQNLKTYIDLHVHPGVTSGPGSTGAPAVPSPTIPPIDTAAILVDR